MTTITIERAIVDRLIEAWDSTVLPKARDGMMQERMEDIRAALAAPDDIAAEMSTVADQYAHKLALDLECVLSEYSGTWYDTAMTTLGAYREAMNAIHERESPTFMGEPLLPDIALAAPAPVQEPTTDIAVKRLNNALREDLDYAWAWHCNIAMSAYDAGCPHDVANEGAARFMQLLAGVDTRKHPGFSGTQTNPMDSTDDRHAQELLAQDITIANMRERHTQELCAYQITVDKLRAERKPMTDDETLALFDRVKVRMLFTDAEAAPFASGVAAAEHFHGIGEKP